MKRHLAALAAVISLAACSNGSSTAAPVPTETVTRTVTSKPSDKPSPELETISKEEVKYHNQSKLEWARSQNRHVLYRDYETAKFVVARALENGLLGEPERYVEVKWRPGMTGWGSIGVNNRWEPDMSKPTAFAHVWFRADGSIDYARGIKGIRIDAGPLARGVIMYDTMTGYLGPMKDAPPYGAAVDKFGAKRGSGSVWMQCIAPAVIGCGGSEMKETITVSELIQLDETAITALGRSMTQLFGPEWRQM